MKVVVECEFLARILHNAMSFVPARSMAPYVALWISESRVEALGTDDIAAGTDWCHTFDPSKGSEVAPKASDREILTLLPKEGFKALEKASREAKKAYGLLIADEGLVTLSPYLDTASESAAKALPTIGAVTTSEDAAADEANWKWVERYTQFRDLFRREDVQKRPEGILANLDYMVPFSKLKSGSTDNAHDIRLGDGYEPLFIKYGPTFRGLVAPVDREQYANTNSQEGLW